jgi:bacteriocin biosynthesis cyclodehydratase domain-containing protein
VHDSSVTSSAPGLELPALRPAAIVFDVSPDELQVAFPNHTVTFTGVPVVRGVQALLAAFEAGATRDDAVAAVAARAELGVGFVEYIFKLLVDNNCLYWKGRDEAPPLDRLGRFYAGLGDDPASVAKRLASTAVTVITLDDAAERLGTVLTSAGLRDDVIALDHRARPEDAIRRLEERVASSTPSVLVCWDIAYRLPFARLVNDWASQHCVPTLFGACEGAVARVGPFFVPRNTACLECANARLLTHAGAGELRCFGNYRQRFADRIAQPIPSHPLFAEVVERQLVLEVAHIALGRPPHTLGALLEWTFGEPGAIRRPVLRVPGCEGCRAPGPRRIPWDVRFPAPIVKGVAQ